MPSITRGIAPELLEAFVDKIFAMEFQEIALIYPAFATTETMTKAFFDDYRMAGVGRFQLKAEGTPIRFSNIVQGLRRRETIFTFALGLRVTKEARDDEQYGMISKMVRDLAQAARDSMDRLAHGVINDGFAGNVYLGLFEGDNQRRALWSTGHVPLRNTAVTQSNSLNPGVAWSPDGLRSALNIFQTMQSEEERFITMWPNMVLAHPDLRWDIETLLETTEGYQTADGDINVFAGNRIGVKPTFSPYITDTDSWSLWKTGKDAVRWHQREKLRTQQSDDPLNLDTLELAYYRCNVSVGEWRYTVGSAPP